ncbi:hypothetical protein LMT8_04615 [Leuconostoc mesenteroides subsp. cremoris TIFN8]|nr:hypothetical protein LMT8_04615 [Leuconostoc mesenteroides subsp. cremoris TIFN8]
MLGKVNLTVREISTDSLRGYLADYQLERGSSKVTIDNMRRIFSSFFGWLEDEDYILKSPVRRIHKIKTDKPIKETFSDESLELLRDACDEIRDLAMIDLSNTERKELIILKTKKVPLFDKQVIRQFGSRSATLFAILSAVLIFVDIPVNLRLIAGGVVLLVLVAIYFLTWHRANTLNDISISIGATTVQIKSGDLFKQDGLKAIAFNEYFDTQVDDVIIAKRSLNGQVIEKYFPDIQGLDKQIESDKSLEKGLIEEMNREVGKKKRYKLGSFLS